MARDKGILTFERPVHTPVTARDSPIPGWGKLAFISDSDPISNFPFEDELPGW